MKIWITSDTHFFHKNIIEYCNRPFQSVEEMNDRMIQNWNEKISNEDVVFHCGDFGFGNFDTIKNIFVRLNGNKNLIKGNHDRLKNREYMDIGFKLYNKDITFPFEEFKIRLSHYPTETSEDNFLLNLRGHSHGNGLNKRNEIDIGVDTNCFYPYNLSELIEKYKKNGFSFVF